MIKMPEYRLRYYLCGPICLTYAARWHGVNVSLEKTSELSNWAFSYTSLLDLKNAANQIGLECHTIRCNPSSLIELLQINSGIAIGQFKKDHFLVLAGYDKTRARLIDPSRKEAKFVNGSAPELQFSEGKPLLIILPVQNSAAGKIILAIVIASVSVGIAVLYYRLRSGARR